MPEPPPQEITTPTTGDYISIRVLWIMQLLLQRGLHEVEIIARSSYSLPEYDGIRSSRIQSSSRLYVATKSSYSITAELNMSCEIRAPFKLGPLQLRTVCWCHTPTVGPRLWSKKGGLGLEVWSLRSGVTGGGLMGSGLRVRLNNRSRTQRNCN